MDRFTPIILCMLMMYGGCQLFKVNNGKANEDTKEIKKSLCENGLKTTAIIQNEYTETEIGSSVSYQYKFDYEVNGEKYTGSLSKSEELTIPFVEITYNQENPESHTTGEPCVAYNKIKDMPSKWPTWLEYVGGGIFLIGLGYIQSAFVHLVRGNKGAE